MPENNMSELLVVHKMDLEVICHTAPPKNGFFWKIGQNGRSLVLFSPPLSVMAESLAVELSNFRNNQTFALYLYASINSLTLINPVQMIWGLT